MLRSNPAPRKILTDQLRSYPAAEADIPELANVKHVFVEAAARANNRAENSHQARGSASEYAIASYIGTPHGGPNNVTPLEAIG